MNEQNSEIQVITFKLKDELFAVDIFEVKEIIRYGDITAVPESENYLEGIINLRGKVISVVNLAKKLDVPFNELNNNTRIIVIESNNSEIGMRVDEVTRVLKFQREKKQPAPKIILDKIGDEFIDGIFILNEEPIILLDLAKVLDVKEFDHLKKESAKVKIEEKKDVVEDVKPDKQSDEKSDELADVNQDELMVEKQDKIVEKTADVSVDKKSDVAVEESVEVKSAKKVKSVDESKNVKKGKSKKDEESTKPTKNKPVTKVKSSKKELKNSDDGFHFKTLKGDELKNAKDLHEYVLTLNDDEFKNFVNEDKNDFYEWLKHSVKDEELANNIKNIKNKKEISDEIIKHLHDYL